MHEADVVGKFVDAMGSHGIQVDAGDIVADGQIHRIHVHGDKKGSKNAWYILHYDQHPAGAFGCNKRLGMDVRIKWSSDKVVHLSPEERIALRKKMRAQREQKAREEAERWNAAASRAELILTEGTDPGDDHPYLQRKGVKNYGLLEGQWLVTRKDSGEVTLVTKRALYVPLRDTKKRVWSLQGIFASDKNPLRRDKSFLQDGKKQGLFYTIGKPKQVDGRSVILLAEGYATAASIHEATGHAVVVTFDAGNMFHVGRAMRGAFPGALLVFCADNDQWTTEPVENPGVHWAKRSAAEVNGLLVVPEFADLATKPSDFNDLHALQGLDEVAAQIGLALTPPAPAEPPAADPEPAAPPPAPAPAPAPAKAEDDAPPPPSQEGGGYFVLLGYDHERYYIFQHEKKQVLVYSKSDFTEAGLIALAPLNWWEMEFPAEKGGIEKKAAVDWIMRGCNKAGIYDPKRLRGRGAWVDAKRMVFHHGGYLTVDGSATPITHIRSRYVYELDISLPDPAPDALTDAEGKNLLDLAGMFRWTKEGSSALLAGWVALSPLCGALRWRPHIWITGGPGCGKTTVMERFVHPLMNGIEIYAQGNSTEAGIRQTLKSDALPVLFDESESNEEKDVVRVQNILSLIRQASTESQAKTLKGTAGGDALAFHIRSMFCLSSIQVAIKQQADMERMARLSLKPKREDSNFLATWEALKEALYALGRDETLPARLFRRSLNLLPITRRNIETFATAAAQRFGSQRDGDQYGTLLAGAWSLISGELATLDDAFAMIDRYDWSEHLEGADGDDSSRALAALIEAHIKLQGGNTVTVYELVRIALNKAVDGVDGMSSVGAAAVLARYGMRIKDGRLLVSNKSEQAKKLFTGTPYASDVRGALKRVPGADTYENKTVRIGGVETKCVSLPLDFADDEQSTLPYGNASAAPRWDPDSDDPPF